MKVHDTPDLRNVALIGHGATGKTGLVAAMLYAAGVEKRLGSSDDGSAPTDFDEEEIARKHSIQTSIAAFEWAKKKINAIDAPGHAAFIADAQAALAAADAALLVVESVHGVQVLTPRTFRFAEAAGVPTVFVVSQLDRERGDFQRALDAIQERFGRAAVPIQLPIGAEKEISGIVDLISMKAYTADGSPKPTVGEIPAEMKDAVDEAHGMLVEMVAESDETLMEAFFENGELSETQLRDGLRAAIASRAIFPVVCTAAPKMIGITPLLDVVVDLLPPPGTLGPARGDDAEGNAIERTVDPDEPVSAFVFKTLADPFAGRLSMFRVMSGTLRGDSSVINARSGNAERLGGVSTAVGKTLTSIDELRAGDLGVAAKLKETHTGDTLTAANAPIRYPAIAFPEPSISYALEPKAKGDEEKISGALARIMEEDPVLRVGRDPQTNELLVSGTSQVHVEVAVTKMKKKFGVEAVLKEPKVPYLEAIRKKAGPIEGKHKKQSGGRGQFGVCVIEMEPLPRGEGYKFVDKIFGGAIPQNYRPAVDKGIQEAAARGVLIGSPVVDFQITLLDGKYHNVDSSEMAFKIAGSLAFREAVKAARPVVLEPVMSVEITAPEEYMGDIMGDLSSRRGKPQGMEAQGAYQLIKAEVPMSEMLTYASTLKSITSDRGTYHMEFDHYAEVPASVQQQLVAEAEKAKEQA